MSYQSIYNSRNPALDDFENFEIESIDDLMFEYDKERDLETELGPYMDLWEH
tara:strand:- start:1399 stop:1554 length:156 start_codon:yes stop_codon:yes gene_type:complete